MALSQAQLAYKRNKKKKKRGNKKYNPNATFQKLVLSKMERKLAQNEPESA